ncbi:hypothetical protein CTI12_AA124090 [Artemisia annua]|uniref:DUF4218 domain-containing protein n=1 Tax=Artemisia annua TaxID=35608 RepID=A0A2U1MTI2_ARTAN|nr:hypothetical protein CTI12_AA124090 [Artemisia annua]
MKKVIWYVLHNSPEIDAYMNEFEREFPDSDMSKEFADWFAMKICKLYVDKDPTCTPDLFALACGPSPTPISINSCVFNGVKFVVHSRDIKRTTQNSGICLPGEKKGEMYYGLLEEIPEFAYTQFKVVLFRVKWFHLEKRGVGEAGSGIRGGSGEASSGSGTDEASGSGDDINIDGDSDDGEGQ